MQVTIMKQKSFALFVLGTLTLPFLSLVYGDDYQISEPLDEPFVVRERLTSGELEEVPPEPAPPSEYQPLDTRTPALVAEEIMRLRDALGAAPLTTGPGFRPMTLSNQSDEYAASPAPWQREDDRRDIRDRLHGMASRPVLPQPHGVPYGATPYPSAHAFITQPTPNVYLQPQPIQIPYGYDPVFEGCHSPMAGPVFTAVESQGQKQIDILRQTAHQLDETAHQLECSEQFERADQVRQLANLLRQDARRGRQAEETTVMRSIQPAASEAAQHMIRAALRARHAGRPTEEADVPRTAVESAETEPGCPACPEQRRQRGHALEAPARRAE